jgi:hypothetical protein
MPSPSDQTVSETKEAIPSLQIMTLEIQNLKEGMLSFKSNEKINATVSLSATKAQKIFIKWFHNGKDYASIPMNIKGASPYWRGSSHVFPKEGEWEIRVENEEDKVLISKKFKAEKEKINLTKNEPLPNSNTKLKKKKPGVGDVLRALEPSNSPSQS